MYSMSNLENNRLIQTFAKLRQTGKKTLIPFLTAGYPDLPTTEAILIELEKRGVRICELGIPFSDPIADGPTIQTSYTEALSKGITSKKIFDMVKHYRQQDGKLALVAMVSYSIVFKRGVESYLSEAVGSGFDGIIIPDLPLEEAADLEPTARQYGLANIMLIAPTTPPERRVEIARHSRGFIYYISVAGITGERDRLPEETIQAVAQLRKHTDTPICIGFGISNAETVRHVCQVADGAIVGSAIIHRITDAKDNPQDELVRKISQFINELIEPIK